MNIGQELRARLMRFMIEDKIYIDTEKKDNVVRLFPKPFFDVTAVPVVKKPGHNTVVKLFE